MSLLVVLTGLALTGVLAVAQFDASRQERARTYDRTSEDVAAAVRLELQRQTDLLVSTTAYVAERPDITSGELRRWVQSVRAVDRYPELLGVLFIRVVDDEDLDRYVEHLRSVDSDQLGPGGSFEVLPPGPRDWYCFVQAVGYQFENELPAIPGFDYCIDPALGGRIAPLRLSGRLTFLSGIELGGSMPLMAIAPVYEGGVDPGTPDARAASTYGGVVTIVDIDAVMDRVFAERDGVGAVLTYRDDWSRAEFTVGDPAATNGSFRTTVSDGWTLQVMVVDPIDEGSMAGVGWWVLAAGLAVSLMLAALLFVLGTSRARALDLVDAATEELRHLALHDPLTGLPNRVLLADRLERVVRHATREGKCPAVLFVDLDGFKAVNDTLGHGAGDVLLRQVGDRLVAALRGVDTIARMGGDEFVVLLHVDRSEAISEVADRLVVAMRPPFRIDDDHVVEVTASVGVAVGDASEPDGERLLRDADLALYEAKAAGRDQWKAST